MTNNFIINPVTMYDKMKSKTKKEIQNYSYFNMLFNILLSMFEYDGFDESFDDFDKRYIDSILCSTGSIACGKIGDKLTFAPCTLGGDVDAYGVGSEVIAPTPIGDIRGGRNTTVAYGINNRLGVPDTLTYWLSSMMAELDTSARSNILYSRLLKIPVVNDEKQKNAINDIYKKLINGEDLTALVSSNVLSDLMEQGIETIELTDSNKIDRLQYVSRFYDDLLKRFANIYGQSLQTQNKSAQTQSDELHGMDSFSFIIPLEMLECRREFVDNINRIFGTSITVDFSKSWKYELARFETRDLNDNNIPDVDEVQNIVNDVNNDNIVDKSDDTTDVNNDSNVDNSGTRDIIDISDIADDDKKEILELIDELKKGGA